MIGGRRRGGVKNWYKRIVLSAEWIQHLRLLLCSHVHDASRPEQSAGMVYFGWLAANSWPFFPQQSFQFFVFLGSDIVAVSFFGGMESGSCLFSTCLGSCVVQEC